MQDIPDAVAGFPTLDLFTPLRQRVPREDLSVDENGDDLETLVVETTGPRVVSAAAAGRRAAQNEYWLGPGVYHLAIVVSEITRALGATVEFPLRLAIAVDGQLATGAAGGRPAPGPLGDPRTGPIAAAAVARDGAPGGTIGVGLIAGAAGGLVAGAAGGYGIVARRRRTA